MFRERDYYGGIVDNWSMASLRSYDLATLWSATLLTAAACYTILVATTILATVLATACELSLTKQARQLLTGLLIGLVAGDGLAKARRYRATFKLEPSFTAYILLSTAMLLPLATVAVGLGYRKLDFCLVTAAKDLGASNWLVARYVMFPSAMRSVRSANAICAALLYFNLVYAGVFLGGKSLVFATLVKLQYLEYANWPSATISILAGAVTLPIVFSASAATVNAVLTGRAKLR